MLRTARPNPTLLDRAFQLVFPLSCPGCGAEASPTTDPADTWAADGWCPSCRSQLDAGDSPRCLRCAAVLRQTTPYRPDQGCASCYDIDLPFDQAVAINNYGGLLRNLITKAKNVHDETLVAQLGRLLGRQLTQSSLGAKIDAIVPVPVHWRRRLKNGFHAAWLISQNIEKTTGIPQRQRTLSAIKPTKKQGTLTRAQRLTNVRHAFVCRRPQMITGKHVLLLDDVLTTGATISEACRVLQKAGAKKVTVAVLARATSD